MFSCQHNQTAVHPNMNGISGTIVAHESVHSPCHTLRRPLHLRTVVRRGVGSCFWGLAQGRFDAWLEPAAPILPPELQPQVDAGRSHCSYAQRRQLVSQGLTIQTKRGDGVLAPQLPSTGDRRLRSICRRPVPRLTT